MPVADIAGTQPTARQPGPRERRMPIPLLHVVENLNRGGLETLVVELARHADRRRFVPGIVCLGPIGELGHLHQAHLPIMSVPAAPGIDRHALVALTRLFRRERPAIVHSHDERPHLFATAAAVAARVPVTVNTAHAVFQRTAPRDVLRRFALAQLTDAIVAVGERVRQQLERVDHLRAPKVRVILNGTALDPPRLGRAEARQALGLSDDAFVVGAIGRLAPVKDHATLIAAVAEARPALPTLRAVIIGDGPLRDALRRDIAERKLAEVVLLAGFRADATALLPAFDVLAQPSLSEGIPLSVLEAMAAELPVIATAIDGNLEVVRAEATGVLVPIRDPGALCRAILELGRDAPRRRLLGAAGRRRVAAEFSFARMAADYDALYLDLLRQRHIV